MAAYPIPGSTPGTWSILGQRLPDFGITEAIGGLFGGQGQVKGASTQKAATTTKRTTPVPTSTKNIPTSTQRIPTSGGALAQAQQAYQQGGGGNNNSGPSEPDYDAMLNEMYGQGERVIGDQESAVMNGYSQDEANLNQQAANQMTDIGNQQTELLGDVDIEEQKNRDVIQTALSQAITAFNALKQQRMSRFGLGSSAGQAVGELANQEYLRQQGSINKKDAENSAAFSKERGRIGVFIKQKTDELTLQKNQLLSQLKQNLSDKLNEIASRRYDLAQNKTRDKMNIMQQAVSQAQQIAQADKEFRQQLGLAAISKMQEVAGRAFSPQEISTAMAEFGISIPSTISTGQSGAQSQSPYTIKSKSPQDEFAATNPYATSFSTQGSY